MLSKSKLFFEVGDKVIARQGLWGTEFPWKAGEPPLAET